MYYGEFENREYVIGDDERYTISAMKIKNYGEEIYKSATSYDLSI